MAIIVRFDTCGTNGTKTGEIYIAADHVTTIAPHPGSTGQAKMCYLSVIGAHQPIMVLADAAHAINKLGLTLK